MHRHNAIDDLARERLSNHLNEIYRDALQVQIGEDLDAIAGQLETVARSVQSMGRYIKQLRGKWYPGADDGAPITYRPAIETRGQRGHDGHV